MEAQSRHKLAVELIKQIVQLGAKYLNRLADAAVFAERRQLEIVEADAHRRSDVVLDHPELAHLLVCEIVTTLALLLEPRLEAAVDGLGVADQFWREFE